MAADRLDSRLSDLTSTWHPAVLRTISIAATSAGNLSKPIGVCGESAANPQLAAVLIIGAITQMSVATLLAANPTAFNCRVNTSSAVRVNRQPRTQSAGFSSAIAFINGTGLSLPASNVRRITLCPAIASNTDL